MRYRIITAACLLAVSGCVPPADQAGGKALTGTEKIELGRKLLGSLVRVEYTFQFDKGESPSSGSSYITEERPMETAGFVLSPTKVLTWEPTDHRRFIKVIHVRRGKQLVEAKVAGYFKDRRAVLMETGSPLTGVTPLAFDAEAPEPYYVMAYTLREDEWMLSTASLRKDGVNLTERGRTYRGAPARTIVVDRSGNPVGIFDSGRSGMDESWKGTPLAWQMYPADEMDGIRKKVKAAAAKSILRVALSFRSPKKARGYRSYRAREEARTEQNVLGLLMDDKKVLVLAPLSPKVTARLERIMVHPPTGKAVPATFAGTFKDYGCLLAELAEPLPGKIALPAKDIREYRDRLLVRADIYLQEKKRVAYFRQCRIRYFSLGWKRMIHLQADGRQDKTFLFAPDCRLVALPLRLRPKVSTKDRWGRGSRQLTPSARLVGLLEDLAGNLDASNVPLTEAEESRLAWLGVELQPLNTELARANGVSDLTRDGSFGAIVSHVYSGSPAAKAGVQLGDILLQLHVEGEPRPLEAAVEEHLGGRPFPWARLDGLSESYYDDIPTPWPPAENQLTRKLTDLGFGKKFKAEFFRDGKTFMRDFVITASPPHYDTARKHKSKDLGLTVRELTYELRRYFHRDLGEPGLIVSKIEPGSKVSVAGLKPFEIITHVDGKPVKTVKEFEAALAEAGAELKLSIKRMMRGRQVKIRMSSGKTPATKPASRPATTKPS